MDSTSSAQPIAGTKGLVVAATSSGSGKTTLVLGLLRALARQGVAVTGAKCGPDYIDPRFHQAACGKACPNLDSWAMSPARIAQICPRDDVVIVEGVMGLFDGSLGGRGSTAELAKALGFRVVLVVDCARMAQSVAAVVGGFLGHDGGLEFAGVILNNLGSARHERLLREALAPLDVRVLGAVYRAPALVMPSRHLGLVQAQERPDLDQFIEHAADHVAASCDLQALQALAKAGPIQRAAAPRLRPPAQSIAVAQDAAFAFAYPHILDDWRRAGAEISLFSPLADQPPPAAEMIYLPGGYPELFAGQLASAQAFRAAMRSAAGAGTQIYGECGGYMSLGDGLVDADGKRHQMLGLLRLETSFAKPRLHLGYRRLVAGQGPFAGRWAAHEFHYATTIRADGPAMFDAFDAQGDALAPMGLVNGAVSGSFAHLIDALASPDDVH